VSYSKVDKAWAEWIAWQLEAGGYRAILRAWDFVAGSSRIHGIQQAVIMAARTIAVVSAAYVTSAYEAPEWETAFDSDRSGAGRKLLPVRIEDCSLPGLLGTRVAIDLFDVNEDVARERLLEAAAGKRGKPDRPPGFPGRRDATAPPQFPKPASGWEAAWQPGRSPFPGLAAFDASRAQVFKGRVEETRRLVRDLMEPAAGSAEVTVIVGPSGCGKSSLTAAGIAPELAKEPSWLVTRPMRPGKLPLTALAEVLSAAARGVSLNWSREVIFSRLDQPGAMVTLVDELLAASASLAERLLLVVDQAEELLTISDADNRKRFLDQLAAVASGPTRVVLTLRSDYLDQLVAAIPAGVRVRAEVLHPLAPNLLPIIITEPARQAGLRIDSRLVDRMVDDTRDGKALPLLAYTLRRLYEAARERHSNILSPDLYHMIGGVQGALIEQADTALAEAVTATGCTKKEALAALLRLLSVDPYGRPTRRAVDLDPLNQKVRGILTPFVARRLLTVDSRRGGSATVTVAHERLLAAWRPLKDAIDQTSNRLRQRAEAEAAAYAWARADRPASRLWSLSLATSTRAALPRDDLVPIAQTFLAASRRHGRRRLVTVFTILVVMVLLATGFGVVAVIKSRAADHQRHDAQTASQISAARALVFAADKARTSDPGTAIQLGVAAYGTHPDVETKTSLVNTLTASRFIARLTGQKEPVASVAFSPDGKSIASGSLDGTVALWDESTPMLSSRPPWILPGHSAAVTSVAFSPRGGLLAAAGQDNTIVLWDVSNPGRPRRLPQVIVGHKNPVVNNSITSIAFSPSGNIIAAGGADNTLTIWDVSNPSRTVEIGDSFTAHASDLGFIEAVAFSPNGRMLAGAGFGGGFDNASDAVNIWDISRPASPRHLATLGYVASSLDFSPDGRVLVAPGGKTGLWDLTDPSRPRGLSGPTLDGSAVFSPDGRTLAVNIGQTVGLYDTSDLSHISRRGSPLSGHQAAVNALGWSPDSQTLATGSADDSVILWDMSDQGLPRRLEKPISGLDQPVYEFAFGPDGKVLATYGADSYSKVQLWNMENPNSPQRLGAVPTGLISPGVGTSIALSADGRILATGGEGNTVRLWDITNARQPKQLGQGLVGTGGSTEFSTDALAFSPRGALLAVGGTYNVLDLWDLSDPSRPRHIGRTLQVGQRKSDGFRIDQVTSIAFSPDGRMLATGTQDNNSIVIWDISVPSAPRRVGEPLTGSSGDVRSMALSPDGHTLASSSNDEITLWGISESKQAYRLTQPFTGGGSLSFSPDGRVLAAAENDKATLWDMENSGSPRQLGDPIPGKRVVKFSPSGHILIVGDDGSTIGIWDTRPLMALIEDPLRFACGRDGNGLADTLWNFYAPGIPHRNPCRR